MTTKRKRTKRPKVGDIVQDSGGRKFAVIKIAKGAPLAQCMDLKDNEVMMKDAKHLTVIGKVPDASDAAKTAHNSQQRTIKRHEVHSDSISRSRFGKTNGPY